MTIEIVEFIQRFRNGFFDFFFNMISFLGEESIYMLLLATILFTVDKKKGEILCITMFFTGVFNNTIKGIIDAPRPFEKYPERITNLRPSTSTGASFPSGHTQMFSSFWMSIYVQFKKNILLYTTVTLSILMAISRMYLGVHFLEDVLTSIVLGFLSAYLIYKYIGPLSASNRLKVYIGLMVLFLPFVFVLNTNDLWKTYGMLVGFVIAMSFERRYVQFEIHDNLIKNCIRVVFGLVLMLSVQLGLKALFNASFFEFISINILDMIRYIFIAFLGLGVYPMFFKKFNF